jgi:hypothetical protein
VVKQEAGLLRQVNVMTLQARGVSGGTGAIEGFIQPIMAVAETSDLKTTKAFRISKRK